MASPLNKITVQAGNILIVDDQIKFRNQLRRIISLEGCKVFEATDTEMAIKIVAKEDIEGWWGAPALPESAVVAATPSSTTGDDLSSSSEPTVTS